MYVQRYEEEKNGFSFSCISIFTRKIKPQNLTRKKSLLTNVNGSFIHCDTLTVIDDQEKGQNANKFSNKVHFCVFNVIIK